MIDLNDPETFKELDPQNVYHSTSLFTAQCRQMVEEYFNNDFYPDKKKVKNVVICGMGGSAFGAHIALSLFQKELKKPLTLISDYHIPSFVDNETMVILISYSGTTEEVLSCLEEAKEKGAMISGFSSGGQLGEILKKDYKGFSFDPKNNPSGQPRIGIGYIVLGTLILLNSLDVISINKEELLSAIEEVDSNESEIKKEAQKVAKSLSQNIPLVLTTAQLIGNAHILRNQLNETAKTFSYFEDIPELNHHLMEGLKYPDNKKLKALFLTSSHLEPRIKARLELTKDVVSKNGISYEEFRLMGSSPLAETLICLSFGAYMTLYMGLLYNLNPSLIPWVDYFKEELAKS